MAIYIPDGPIKRRGFGSVLADAMGDASRLKDSVQRLGGTDPESKRLALEEDQRKEASDPDSTLMRTIREFGASRGIKIPENVSYAQYEKSPIRSAIDARIKADEETRVASAKAKNPSELKQNQFAAAGFSKMARAAEDSLNRLTSAGFDPTSLGAQVQGYLGGPLERLKGQDVKGFEQAQRQFVQAVLRKESGATITPDEMSQNAKKYFPQPGDGPDVLAQKAQARAQAVAALEAEGSPAIGQVASAGFQAPQGGGARGGVPSAQAANAPKVGVVDGGYMFTGGDPSDAKNWKKVK